MIIKGKLNVGVLDGQWGSSGKGKFNAYLADKYKIDFAISQNSVNASHIVVWDDGTSYKFNHLPTSVINHHVRVIMGAGASIDLQQLLKEIEDWKLTPERLFIHPNAVVITEDDIAYEKGVLQRIASTMTGNGAAMGRKVMRHPNVRTADSYPQLRQFIADTSSCIAHWLKNGDTGIIETAQGFDLSMDHGMLFYDENNGIHKAYPYTTSRNVDPLTFAGLSGVPSRMLGNVLLNLRTYPIKVGDGSNTEFDGLSGVDMRGSNSGPCWPDQHELDWERDLGLKPEITSLTKRKRRVFSFSEMQLKHITKIVQPTHIFLNFVNYLDPTIAGKSGQMSMDTLRNQHYEVWNMVQLINTEQYWVNTEYAGKVVLLGTGAKHSEVIEIV